MGLAGNGVFNVFLYSVGGIVVIIVMIGSILIYNSFNISMNEHTSIWDSIVGGSHSKAAAKFGAVWGLYWCSRHTHWCYGKPAEAGLVISVVIQEFWEHSLHQCPFNIDSVHPAIISAAAIKRCYDSDFNPIFRRPQTLRL